MIFLQIIFWLTVFLILHTYVIYPVLLKLLSKGKKGNPIQYSKDDDLPVVTILMSAFNEEEIIEEKMHSVFKTNYPIEKIEVLIGSDCSTDKTNEILEELQRKYSGLHFYPFTKRQGKPNIINQLFEKSKGEILILTDANVIFDENTIFNMIRHYKNEKIGLVDTHMINKGLRVEGISIQENAYISREVHIKNKESVIWGSMIGPFGGCYSIRKKLYTKVPVNYTVDDFFISMKVLEQGYKTINDLDAKVYEDVSNNIADEFRRKIRIATGNFQNLGTFKKLLWPITSGVAFSFLSHKVLRWLTPFFILLSYLINTELAIENELYEYLLMAYTAVFFLPLLDYLLKKINIHIIVLRFVTHFLSMNTALFTGFIKYLNGIESNVWKPTKRNQ